jgi:drug/metabolite transporter (DMT)-like permease
VPGTPVGTVEDASGFMATAAHNLRAALLMIAAMACFCINDAFIKALAARVPIGELMAVRGAMIVGLMLVLLPRLGLRIGRPDRFTLWRALGEVGVTFAFLTALTVLPLGDTYTLYFAGPILLTTAAALLLSERVGPRRWVAVLVGFLGVLVALGLPSQWQLASLLAVAAAVISVARDICTRKVASSVGSGTVAFATGTCVALAGALTSLSGAWVALSWPDLGLCALAALGAAAGHVGFVAALRMGELSFIATFRYSAIPMAMALDLAFWGDVPTLQMLTGGALIMGSGLYFLWRERRLHRAAAAAGQLPRARAGAILLPLSLTPAARQHRRRNTEPAP